MRKGPVYRHYLEEIKRVADRIKYTERLINRESLEARPELADNPRWRETRKFKPHEILNLMGGDGFYIGLYPSHKIGLYPSHKKALPWVRYLLNRPDFEFRKLDA